MMNSLNRFPGIEVFDAEKFERADEFVQHPSWDRMIKEFAEHRVELVDRLIKASRPDGTGSEYHAGQIESLEWVFRWLETFKTNALDRSHT